LERDALVVLEGDPDAARSFEAPSATAGTDAAREPKAASASRLDLGIGLAGAALIGLDLAVQVDSRRRKEDAPKAK
jgi:hypothetical protein